MDISGRDWCNMYYIQSTLLGMTSLGMNVAQGKAATTFACSLPQADPDRLGIMGLSGGGTMCLWMTLCDKRFKASEIICYSDLWRIFCYENCNICGMQVAPGLYGLVDVPDLQGLVAPAPLLVTLGAEDRCFGIDGAMACYRQVEAIYRAAGAPDHLELDLHAGGHAWGGKRAVDFFTRHLVKNPRVP